MFVPESDAPEAALIPGLEVHPVKTLADLYDHLSGRRLVETYQPSGQDVLEPLFIPTDFAEIKGQEHVKRACSRTNATHPSDLKLLAGNEFYYAFKICQFSWDRVCSLYCMFSSHNPTGRRAAPARIDPICGP